MCGIYRVERTRVVMSGNPVTPDTCKGKRDEVGASSLLAGSRSNDSTSSGSSSARLKIVARSETAVLRWSLVQQGVPCSSRFVK